ncbi:hypothetical protein B0H63DRAFT_552493 [Podospora didyma]|uniref:Uncharacterized protein n=1 Tax=Podospora didyma TaxID=330526 RepID=A0AAE0K6F0_9PEZI|nr:hypothetical protein B0H63DRAFT_552493 [Podospora didyma]
MFATTFFVNLICLALAAIVGVGASDDASYPPYLITKGFTLVINVTDTTNYLYTRVQGNENTGWHDGAGLQRATQSETTVLSDFLPTGFNVVGLRLAEYGPGPKYNMRLDLAGILTSGIMLARGGNYSYLRAFEDINEHMSFVICNETLQFISRADERFPALDYLRYSCEGDD